METMILYTQSMVDRVLSKLFLFIGFSFASINHPVKMYNPMIGDSETDDDTARPCPRGYSKRTGQKTFQTRGVWVRDNKLIPTTKPWWIIHNTHPGSLGGY